MKRLEARDAALDGVRSVTVPAGGVEPAALLRRSADRVRGFWARGRRWVAHRGAVAELRVEAGDAGPDRFDVVWRRGVPLLERVEAGWTPPGSDVRPARFYGGFSFRPDDGPAGGCWEGFAPARFVLPAVELVGDDRDARLTLRRRCGDRGADPGELREEAEQLVAGLRGSRSERATGAGRGGVRGRTMESDRATWTSAVAEAIDWIERDRVSKVVLARILDVTTAAGPDPVTVVLGLWRQNPGTHVFLFEPAPDRAVVGAAPETVATVSDDGFRATAVAGSIARGASPEEQEALAVELLESEKDRAEHAIAVRDMVERLRPVTRELDWDSEPHVLTLSRIQHLETRLQATLRPDESVLSALGALHPTPAVCGYPRDAALDFLRLEEPFDRGWYAGPVGWFDARGHGVFAPALRSAVRVGERGWRLFAGAGIVRGSDPDLEWEETAIKFQPVLRALEADVPGTGAGG